MPTGGLGRSGKIREALRDETRDYARDFPIGFDLATKNNSAYVHSLLRYHDKILAGICGSGEIWILDENGWNKGYKIPGVPTPLPYNFAAFLAHCFFTAKNLAIMAGQSFEAGFGMLPTIVTYDGTTFRRYYIPVVGGISVNEFLSAVEYNDKLYLGAMWQSDPAATGRVYESSDGVTFTNIRVFGAGTQFPRLAVFGGYLWAVLQGSGDVWRFDGSTWTNTGSVGEAIYAIGATDTYLFLVAGGGKIYRSADGATLTLVAILPGTYSSLNLVRSGRGFYICGEDGYTSQGALFRAHSNGYAIESIATRLGAAVIDVEEYMGTLLLGLGEWFRNSYEMTGGIVPLKPGEKRLSQVDIKLWDAKAIAANAETDPAATLGWSKKTVYFKSNTAGTLTIYVDPRGDGTWEIYDTATIALNTFTPYTFPQEANFARLKLAFNQIATVDAYVVVAP